MLEAGFEEPGKLGTTHAIPFKYNFSTGTSRELKYSASPEYHKFLNKAIRGVKRSDLAMGNKIDLHKRGRKAHN